MLKEKMTDISNLREQLPSRSKKFLNNFEKNTTQLLKKSDIRNNTAIDIERSITTEYFAFLWQQQILYLYKVYVTAIGAIEYRMDYEIKQKEWEETFKRKYNFSKFTKLNKQRDEIVSTLIELQKQISFSVDESILKSLMEFPCYKNFSDIYKENAKGGTQLALDLEFINSYNNGYIESAYLDIENILEVFNKCDAEVKYHLKENEIKLNKVRRRNK